MSHLNYPKKYPTLLKYKEEQNIFNHKLNQYLALEDKYNKLVEKQIMQAKWKSVPGTLNDVVATGESNIWGYNSKGEVYTCKKPCLTGKWQKTGGNIKNIAGDKSVVYGIGNNDALWKIPQDNSSGWKSMGPKKFDKITTNNSNSIIGSKDIFDVQLRITLKCSGGKNTYDTGINTNLNNIQVQRNGNTLVSKSVNMAVNGDANTSVMNFETDTNMIDNIILTVNNSTREIKHSAWSFHFDNPFKEDKVSYPYLSYLKIEKLESTGSYGTLYESSINISTGGGNNNYSVSLGNGLKIGYNLFQCAKPCDDNNWQNIQTDKKIQDISADGSYIYMTDTDNILWRCPGGCSSGNWEKDPIGSAKKVDASGDRYLRVIGSDNMLWERDKRKWGQEWTPTNKVISSMSMSNTNMPFLVNEDVEGMLWTIEPNNNIEIALRPPYQKWRDEPNINATVGLESANKKSTDDWDFIGSFDTYDGCKFASLNAEKPYNKITYFNEAYNGPNLKKTCWGNKIGGKFKNKSQENATTGYPPYGYTKLGGMVGFEILREMKKLNKELIMRAQGLKRLTIPNNVIGQSMIKQKTAIATKMDEYVKNLEKDSRHIHVLEKQNAKLDGKKEDSSLNMTQKQSAYIGISITMIILLIITAKQLKK